jgi:uncharacterized protein
MNVIRKSGVFLEKDKQGFLLSDSSFQKITQPWLEAVEAARQIEIRRLGERMHSLYLRGSAARGRAVQGRSDLDLFAVVFDDERGAGQSPPWSEEERKSFLERFPFVVSVESSEISLANVFGPFHYYRFAIKTAAVCIAGEDLLPQIEPYKADAPIAEEWFRIFPHFIDQFQHEIQETTDPEREKGLCMDIMKVFLRSGMLLVMRRTMTHSRDLYPSYQAFSTIYPEREPQMMRALELAVNPIADAKELVPFVREFGTWMNGAAETEFGKLELLPAELTH